MQRNALIREIAYYHPDNIVDNDYYIDHFKQQNKSINGLLHATGRRSRYIATDMNEIQSRRESFKEGICKTSGT